MMELVDFSDPGLVILPPHRLVRGISKSTLNELMAELESLFEIDELPLSMPGVWQQVDDSLSGEANQVKLVLFGLAAERLFVLSLRDLAAVSQMMPYFHSELYKKLSVSVVDHIILEELLGLDSAREEAFTAYSYDKVDAVNKVSNEEYQLACLVSPIKAEMIKAVADVGEECLGNQPTFIPNHRRD